MHLRIALFVVLACLFLAFVPRSPARAAEGSTRDFDDGMQEFRAGNYAAALRSFLDARRGGLDTPGLHYNLGSTYYRLARYVEAGREFQGLARDPQWAPIANYNLGLIAHRMGRPEEAAARFESARRTAADPNLRALATAALERFARGSGQSTILASLAGGYDSNVTLSPGAATVGVSNQDDIFYEALAAASRRLSGTAPGATYAYGGLVLRKYRDVKEFDQLGLRLGLNREIDAVRAQGGVGGYVDVVYVGGALLEQAAALDLQGRARLGGSRDVRGRYQFERVEGGGGSGYLDGWQQRLSADTGFAADPVFVRIGYQLEVNRRRDFELGAEFTSYSPTRHSLLATVTPPELGGWRTEARGEFRISRYRNSDRFNGGALEVRREDTRYSFALRANRRVSATSTMFIDYSYYRNQSNLDIYDYGRNQILAGIEAALER